MLSQTFTKAEVHQLALGLFKDIPFQTEDGKNKMKAALHLYRSGNVYNIMRTDEDLRATMLADGNKVHIFLNIQTGFYGIHLDSEQLTPMQAEIIYVTAALLALFASVDSVGAFLDLWKAHHISNQTIHPVDVPTAIGDDYFEIFQRNFTRAYQEQLASVSFPSKEAYFIACNSFIISAMETERKQGYACGLSFSYIPLYIFAQMFDPTQVKHSFSVELLRDTFLRRLLQLAEKELKKLPKDVFHKFFHTNKELSSYIACLNTCIQEIGMDQVASLYCELFSFQLDSSWHEKQLEQITHCQTNPAQQMIVLFHLVEMQQYDKVNPILDTFPSAQTHTEALYLEWNAFAPFVERIFHSLTTNEQIQATTKFLDILYTIFSPTNNTDTLEAIMRLYLKLAEIPECKSDSVDCLRRMLPNSLPYLAEITWKDKNYTDWIGLIMLLPWEAWPSYRKELQVLISDNNQTLLPLLHRLIQYYIEEKNKSSYQSATYYLRKLKDIYIKSGHIEGWHSYYNKLKENYRNLRSLQAMLLKEIGK